MTVQAPIEIRPATLADAEPGLRDLNILDVTMMEPQEVSNAISWLEESTTFPTSRCSMPSTQARRSPRLRLTG